ncbi:MerR family transcriptional regulator [Nocardia sp. CDC159]|uniref:MerR family transcriptional regulator n=1 Tax=Nocardia pulmonis TaxID=2951408 RepID=A0A9X2E808_9NOCA|nr:MULTISPECIES: MerR family transcriptional regulator [Nocardia]MCM6775979.1 MerR family transcriptional regulator [Nocardia pulmonis]MCM6788694.1 MerR family transcriptional regulator [Nocardia sp. CDC159]
MRIGELAKRTETSPRLLRYYEEQGLIRVARRANGYRDYDERLVEQVLHIRGLLEAGLPTRLIKQILPCLGDPTDIHFADASPEIIATLEDQRDRLSARIELLSRNRDAMSAYIDSLKGCMRRSDASVA